MKTYQKSFYLSLFLHTLLLLVLLIDVQKTVVRPAINTGKKTPLIQAVTVNSAEITAEVAKLKAQKSAAKRRQLRLHRRAKQRRLKERTRLRQLKKQAISQIWIIPENIPSSLSCKLRIRLGTAGAVLTVQVIRSSGNQLLDRSAKMAVYKASPLPIPDEKYLRTKFKVLNLTVRPEEVIALRNNYSKFGS